MVILTDFQARTIYKFQIWNTFFFKCSCDNNYLHTSKDSSNPSSGIVALVLFAKVRASGLYLRMKNESSDEMHSSSPFSDQNTYTNTYIISSTYYTLFIKYIINIE